ncbi:MAG: hypothetical protein IKL59_00540 [Clostridia bacterium]|nr:hypothetical protein [Clostridia bacterium]
MNNQLRGIALILFGILVTIVFSVTLNIPAFSLIGLFIGVVGVIIALFKMNKK